ncbi:YdcF family protein [Oxalobacter sp. OttesenSCG-928-P03]|nr:YdcF family protein [Oxalobacter sp. OttesenSCG-928-P03]
MNRGKTRIALAVVIALFAVVAAAVGMIAHAGFNDRIFRADAGVVLGNHVYADGTPSPRLASRLDKAAELYKKGVIPLIIASGGKGKNQREEAPAMRDYLVRQGVPAKDIIVDTSGVDTRRTAVFTAAYLKARGLTSVIAISQYFHLPRCRIALESEGVEKVGTAHADYREWREVYSLLREIPGWLAYRLRLK